MTPNEFREIVARDQLLEGYVDAAFWSTSANLGKCDNPECENWENERVQPNPEGQCPVCKGKLWATDRSFQQLGFTLDDCGPHLLDTFYKDCAEFKWRALPHLDKLREQGYVDSQFGHDFWLTREGHGCGFWDGDYPEPEAGVLSEISEDFGGCDLYVGDDGKVYS